MSDHSIDHDVGLLLAALAEGPRSYVELHQAIGEIDSRRLTLALEEAVDTGRVVSIEPERPGSRVDRYVLSDKAFSPTTDAPHGSPSPKRSPAKRAAQRVPIDVWADLEAVWPELRGLGQRPVTPADRVNDVIRRARVLLVEYAIAVTSATERDELIKPAPQVEISGPDGAVHYRRPADHPDVATALRTPGYTVRAAVKGGA